MNKLTQFTDSLPGGEKRATTRAEIAQAKAMAKNAKQAENSIKMTNRPLRTRLTWGAVGALGIGTLYFLNQTGGDRAVGEAAGKSVNVGVEGGVGAVAGGANILSEAAKGGREAISEIKSESDISLQWPVTSGDNQVSNTTPVNPENSDNNDVSQGNGSEGQLVAIKGAVTVTEVPLGEDGERNYSAAGVVATPIQIAKACFMAEGIEMSSTEWAAVYNNQILTVQSNFEAGGAFFGEQSPTPNPGDVVNCQ